MGRARSTEGVSILLVDSEVAYRRVAARALASRGFKVAEAECGDAALTVLKEASPDAVVLDVGKDGAGDLAVLARIHSANPELPLIMLAEEGEIETAMCGLELGAKDVLHKPADLDHLATRIRSLVTSATAPPRERSIAELMVPASSYARVYEDEPVQQVLKVLTRSLFRAVPGKLKEQGHRSLLVYSREETFLGCIRLNDLLALLIPPSRRETYEPFEVGMFVACCKLLGNITAGELLGEQRFVDVEAPLMEAVQLMVVDSLINIPVLRQGELVGILSDRNLLLEACVLANGEL